MSYDTWKTTPPDEERPADLCGECNASPCECCEDCGAAPDVKCEANCPDQLRRDVFDREQRISTLELQLQSQAHELKALKLTIRKLNRSKEHKHAMMEFELEEIKLREAKWRETVKNSSWGGCCPFCMSKTPDTSGMIVHRDACPWLLAQEAIADAPRS